MDTMMNTYRPTLGQITIRCRNRINWYRIAILTLASVLVSWLAFGLGCAVLESTLDYGQALTTPLALIFLAINLVTTFITQKNKYTEQ